MLGRLGILDRRSMMASRQADRQTGIQADRQTSRQADRQTITLVKGSYQSY